MKLDDYIYLCKTIGGLSAIPVRIYESGSIVFAHSQVPLIKDCVDLYKSELDAIRENVGYFITSRFQYFGVINSGPYKVVIGPTSQVKLSHQELRELAFEMDVAEDDAADFIHAMSEVGMLPLESLLQMLCAMNFVLNGERKELADIAIYDEEQKQLKRNVEKKRADKRFDFADLSSQHNTLAIEQQITHMVLKGDTAALKRWAGSAPAVRGGVIARDQLRQIKNTFIVTATLVSRAAIQGGMSAEDALSLSDAYIQQCEMLNRQDKIINLQYHMVLEFAEQVECLRNVGGDSKLALQVADYVAHHLSEAIKTEDVAKTLYMSRGHLSARFHKETGITLTGFIAKEKTEEAKRLLRYTDKSISSIGSYLGYSSQSHFLRVFRKHTDLTPGEYREKYAHSIHN